MSFPFFKLVGAGNDFIFLDKSLAKNISDIPKFVKKICNRQWGVGADGLAFIKTLRVEGNKNFLEWDFYNNDGSHAEMCGNAARCAVIYNQEVFHSKICSLKTVIGNVSGRALEKGAIVSWTLKSLQPEKKSITLDSGKAFNGYFIDTGVPHFVVFDEPHGSIDGNTCLEIQNHKDFSPRQTNVTLVTRQNTGADLTMTFERGVKGFTLACGTGVIAAATTLNSLQPKNSHSLVTPGGLLTVQILPNNKVELEGPAKISFKGTYL